MTFEPLDVVVVPFPFIENYGISLKKPRQVPYAAQDFVIRQEH